MKIVNGKIYFLFFILFTATFSNGFGQSGIEKGDLISDLKLDLVEAIELAIANNPQVNRALLSVKDADELVKIAYSELFPDIVSSINYTRNIEIPVTFVPAQFFDPNAPAGTLAPVEFGTDNNWQGGISVSQNIFKGEAIIGVGTSTIFKTVQRENLRAVTQQVVTQARVAYYSTLVSEERLRLQQAQIDRLEANLNENRARERAGLVDPYDVLRLEVQLSNARPQLVEAEYMVQEAYRNLKIALGLPLQLEFSILGELNAFDILDPEMVNGENLTLKRVDLMNRYTYSNESESGMEQQLGLRGDLRVIDATIDLKDKEISAVKSRYLPTITANYNLQWTAVEAGRPNFFRNEGANTNPIRFQTLGVSVRLPLFQGLSRVANVNRVQIERKDLEEQKRAATLSARNDILSAKEDLDQAFETAEGRRRAVELAQEGYDRAKKRFDQGLGSQLELTEAEIQVREAEVNYAQMVFGYLSAKARYDLAVGKVPMVDQEIE
ncbi:TolC family protein [Balneola sp. MJW-20]|uniref:TolC family protein n=1 Tax=Gracilimonas aurantiaca TaxID=3234185 RepID=UPI003465E51E